MDLEARVERDTSLEQQKENQRRQEARMRIKDREENKENKDEEGKKNILHFFILLLTTMTICVGSLLRKDNKLEHDQPLKDFKIAHFELEGSQNGGISKILFAFHINSTLD